MQENLKVRRNPISRKIVTLFFLPISIFLWMTGWLLIQIEQQAKPSEITQTLRINNIFEPQNNETKAHDKDSSANNEPQIIA